MPRGKRSSYQAQASHGPSPSDGALIPYSPPSERDTLLPGKRPRRKPSLVLTWSIPYWVTAGLFLFFLVCNLGMHFVYCPLYPSQRIEIRHGWEKEVADHELLSKRWDQDEKDHIAKEQDWNLKEESHKKEVARWMEEEEERQEAVRRAMEHERRQWSLELEEHDKEVARRTREEQARQERVRKEWADEYERNVRELQELRHRENQQREAERQRWKREVAEHDKIEEEHRRREEEERQKLNMFWGHVEAHGCITYGTREYTATLMNLPATWQHRVEACKATPLEVHGINYLPKSCEDKGPGHVIGRWEVSQHEPDCVPFWLWYNDKGCTSPGSGKRRIEHYLENLPKGGDWREFCATTPAHFRGMEFEGAQECFQHNLGTYGHWEIDDATCSTF